MKSGRAQANTDFANYATLLHCTGAELGSGRPESKFRELIADVRDWDSLVQALSDHGLLLIFNALIQETESERLMPEIAAEQIRSAVQQATVLNVLQEGALKSVLAALRAARIPIMMPKGLFLSQQVYSYPHVRPSADIDLFTGDDHVAGAQTVLERLGYDQVNSDRDSVAFERTDMPGVVLELQAFPRQKKARLRSSYVVDVDDIWVKSKPVDFCGAQVNQMKAEHLLLYLCVHLAARHDFERLIWVRDLREVIGFYGACFDWDLFVRCADAWQSRGYAYFALLLAKRVASAQVPDDVLDLLRPDSVAARILEQRFVAAEAPRLPLRMTSIEYQLNSLLADGFARRRWAEVMLPYHFASRVFRASREQRSVTVPKNRFGLIRADQGGLGDDG